MSRLTLFDVSDDLRIFAKPFLQRDPKIFSARQELRA